MSNEENDSAYLNPKLYRSTEKRVEYLPDNLKEKRYEILKEIYKERNKPSKVLVFTINKRITVKL